MPPGRTREELAAIDKSAKPHLRNGSPVCLCSMCDLYFAGPSVFDLHQFEASSKCRTPEQMGRIGMVTNAHGVWQKGVWIKKAKKVAA